MRIRTKAVGLFLSMAVGTGALAAVDVTPATLLEGWRSESPANTPFSAAPPAGTQSGLETYPNECGECHVAYPPRLLPSGSWRALMSNPESHFGVDATLDAATTRAIATYLEQNAGRERGAEGPRNNPTLRITDTAWFRHEHDEIPAATWSRKSIGSASNCSACHTDATQGRFSEHTVRIPR